MRATSHNTTASLAYVQVQSPQIASIDESSLYPTFQGTTQESRTPSATLASHHLSTQRCWPPWSLCYYSPTYRAILVASYDSRHRLVHPYLPHLSRAKNETKSYPSHC